MKFNILLIIVGVALVSTAVIIPYPWAIIPTWIGAMSCCNGVFGFFKRYNNRELWR